MRRFNLLNLITWAIACALPLSSAFAQAGGGGGGQEGQGGGDIEAHLYLRVNEVAHTMKSTATEDLSEVDWKIFASIRVPVLPVSQRPRCLFSDGTTVERDACFFATTPQASAHIEVYEDGFNRLSPARQRRLAAHEIFRAMGIGLRDEFYQLSNAIYSAMPDTGTPVEGSAPGTMQGLFSAGVYSTTGSKCGFKLFRSQDGQGQPAWMVSFVKTDPKSTHECLALGKTALMACGPLACTIEYGISRFKRTSSQGGGTYVLDRHRSTLTPLDVGHFNLLKTVERHDSGGEIQVLENGIYSRQDGY